MPAERGSGRCLCGAVTYEIRGPVRDAVVCHCEECRRWCGDAAAFAGARREHVAIQGPLRWIVSPASDRGARRGFCTECGSSLFWEPSAGGTISIAAGTLDEPTGLRIAGQWYTHAAGDYYELAADDLPRDDPATIQIP